MNDDVPPPLDDRVDIRHASLEDAGEMLTLQRAAYVSEARIYQDPELPPLTEELDDLRADLASCVALKAVVGHRIIGAIRAHVKGRTLHIQRMAVAPDWQGRGVGSRLMTNIETQHEGGVVDVAALFTGHLSTMNLAMYWRRGYREQRREQLSPAVQLVHLIKVMHPTGAREL